MKKSTSEAPSRSQSSTESMNEDQLILFTCCSQPDKLVVKKLSEVKQSKKPRARGAETLSPQMSLACDASSRIHKTQAIHITERQHRQLQAAPKPVLVALVRKTNYPTVLKALEIEDHSAFIKLVFTELCEENNVGRVKSYIDDCLRAGARLTPVRGGSVAPIELALSAPTPVFQYCLDKLSLDELLATLNTQRFLDALNQCARQDEVTACLANQVIARATTLSIMEEAGRRVWEALAKDERLLNAAQAALLASKTLQNLLWLFAYAQDPGMGRGLNLGHTDNAELTTLALIIFKQCLDRSGLGECYAQVLSVAKWFSAHAGRAEVLENEGKVLFLAVAHKLATNSDADAVTLLESLYQYPAHYGLTLNQYLEAYRWFDPSRVSCDHFGNLSHLVCRHSVGALKDEEALLLLEALSNKEVDTNQTCHDTHARPIHELCLGVVRNKLSVDTFVSVAASLANKGETCAAKMNGLAPIHLLAQLDCPVVQRVELIQRFAQRCGVSLAKVDGDRKTLLHYALSDWVADPNDSILDTIDFLSELLRAVDVNASTKQGDTPLSLVVMGWPMHKHIAPKTTFGVMQRLIDAGASLSDRLGQLTLLQAVATVWHDQAYSIQDVYDALHYLIAKKKLDTNKMGLKAGTLLHVIFQHWQASWCQSQEMKSVVELCLNHGVSLARHNQSKQTALHVFCDTVGIKQYTAFQMKELFLLLTKQAGVSDAEDQRGHTPLELFAWQFNDQHATFGRYLDLIRGFTEKGASARRLLPAFSRQLATLGGLAGGLTRTLEQLSEQFDFDYNAEVGNTSVLLAFASTRLAAKFDLADRIQALVTLIKKGADVNATDGRMWTLSHLLLLTWPVTEAVPFLVTLREEYQADFTQNIHGQGSVLHCALAHQAFTPELEALVFDTLNSKGVDAKRVIDSSQRTLAHVVCAHRMNGCNPEYSLGLLQKLQAAGVDLTLVDDKGNNLAHVACQKTREPYTLIEILSGLARLGVNLTADNHANQTILHAVVLHNCPEVFDAVLNLPSMIGLLQKPEFIGSLLESIHQLDEPTRMLQVLLSFMLAQDFNFELLNGKGQLSELDPSGFWSRLCVAPTLQRGVAEFLLASGQPDLAIAWARFNVHYNSNQTFARSAYQKVLADILEGFCFQELRGEQFSMIQEVLAFQPRIVTEDENTLFQLLITTSWVQRVEMYERWCVLAEAGSTLGCVIAARNAEAVHSNLAVLHYNTALNLPTVGPQYQGLQRYLQNVALRRIEFLAQSQQCDAAIQVLIRRMAKGNLEDAYAWYQRMSNKQNPKVLDELGKRFHGAKQYARAAYEFQYGAAYLMLALDELKAPHPDKARVVHHLCCAMQFAPTDHTCVKQAVRGLIEYAPIQGLSDPTFVKYLVSALKTVVISHDYPVTEIRQLMQKFGIERLFTLDACTKQPPSRGWFSGLFASTPAITLDATYASLYLILLDQNLFDRLCQKGQEGGQLAEYVVQFVESIQRGESCLPDPLSACIQHQVRHLQEMIAAAQCEANPEHMTSSRTN